MKVRTSVLAILGLAFASGAMAQSATCTAITAVPYTITSSGTYCLTSNLTANLASGQTAITIAADDVVLDLNGRALNNSTSNGWGIGQTGAYVVRNATIRNGTVRGFLGAISIATEGYLVENMLLTENVQFGVSFGGNNGVVRNNRIQKIGTAAGAQAFGMYGNPQKVQIVNNDISDTTTTAIAVGIFLSGASDAVVAGNRINKVSATQAPANSTGILAGGTNQIVRDNIIVDATKGIDFSTSGTGKYMGNITQGVTTPYTNGTAAGSTNY